MSKIAMIMVSSLVILAILAAAAVFISDRRFEKRAREEIAGLLAANSTREQGVITPEDLAGLPEPVQKWLKRSGVVGRERVHTVFLKQEGMMQLEPEQAWMPVEAEQYFTVESPGFIWKAKVKMNPLMFFTGLDKYCQGHGSMQIKLLSLIPVVDAQGTEIDQGTLVRYLGEIIWFPAAALSDYLQWEEQGPNAARVTMSYGGITASATFDFTEQGDVVGFSTMRYREVKGQYSLEKWGARITGYREFNSLRIANEGEVIWYLPEGEFPWYRFRITQLEYNV